MDKWNDHICDNSNLDNMAIFSNAYGCTNSTNMNHTNSTNMNHTNSTNMNHTNSSSVVNGDSSVSAKPSALTSQSRISTVYVAVKIPPNLGAGGNNNILGTTFPCP
jgi:hypothetical protein